MNISSYNITDVAYHYIGLRVLAGLPSTARREEQINAISRNVLKYVSDKALRLMLPEPRGTFETVGEKICQELVHFQFARFTSGAYELIEVGRDILNLLDERKYVELRRIMISIHLQTYDNLRAIVQRYLEIGSIWLPIVEANYTPTEEYVQRLLEPTFNGIASGEAVPVLERFYDKSPKKIEDALREKVLRRAIPGVAVSVSLFRALSDRLISLRLLNTMKVNVQGYEFIKSYSPCVAKPPLRDWHAPLKISLSSNEIFTIYISEPDMTDKATQHEFLEALVEAFSMLSPQAGYYDLPEVRDLVCEKLMIPEAAFDEGVNQLLDLRPSPLSVGLSYERISGRRKPLISNQKPTQLYNLIRRT